ncbi:MAG: thioredoxin-disulfide reductase [Firmicutes bacterium]|nr:thioredoxin-disulfide reductase [Bacillota bacterium]
MTNANLVSEKIYDVVIIGGGPGGYAAALYSARSGFTTLVIEKLSIGGQISITDQVDNYPGFDNGIGGWELGQKMKDGAERFGAETVMTEVTKLDVLGTIKKIETKKGTYLGKTVMIATGADPKKLGIPGESEMAGSGVSFCATCDGMFYRGKKVVIVGGGNTAVGDAIILSRIAEKVTLVHHKDELTATKIYRDQLAQTENVEILYDSEATEILYNDFVEGVRVKDLKTGEERVIEANGAFVAIGRAPASYLVEGQVELDKWGYIVADETTKTSVPGVFAIGDVRTKTLRQVITAAADGATASFYAEEYLAELLQTE